MDEPDFYQQVFHEHNYDADGIKINFLYGEKIVIDIVVTNKQLIEILDKLNSNIDVLLNEIAISSLDDYKNLNNKMYKNFSDYDLHNVAQLIKQNILNTNVEK